MIKKDIKIRTRARIRASYTNHIETKLIYAISAKLQKRVKTLFFAQIHNKIIESMGQNHFGAQYMNSLYDSLCEDIIDPKRLKRRRNLIKSTLKQLQK